MPPTPMQTTNIPRLLEGLLAVLPLHAEEGGAREVLAERDLVAAIASDPRNRDSVPAVVALVRRLYDALGLLEPSELMHGCWAFVSFPASLLGRSVLETLAAEGQGFVEPGYWIQGAHRPIEVVEQQRGILRRLEGHRMHSHPSGEANTIRTVHVAWGLIRLGGDLLLRLREDKNRPEVGGYVFPGGRLNLTDLPVASRSANCLRDLFQVESEVAKAALPTTLARELNEELGILPSEYAATYQRTLTPFKMLEGTRNNHAFTRYNISISTILLSRAGELKVLDRVGTEPEVWAWFTPEELATGRRADGKSAFVAAVSAQFGTDTERFFRNEVPDSSSTPPVYRTDGDSIELPARAGEPVLKGLPGREKALSFSPNHEEWELLMILGRHARSLRVRPFGETISLLGAQWVRLNDAALLKTAQTLAQRLQELAYPCLEVDSLGHCRLSIDASQVFFHPDCFEYLWQLEAPKKSITLTLREVDTKWGVLVSRSVDIPLAPQFARDLQLTEKGKSPEGEIERESRRLFEPARRIGLRKFVGVVKGVHEIVVPEAGHN